MISLYWAGLSGSLGVVMGGLATWSGEHQHRDVAVVVRGMDPNLGVRRRREDVFRPSRPCAQETSNGTLVVATSVLVVTIYRGSSATPCATRRQGA